MFKFYFKKNYNFIFITVPSTLTIFIPLFLITGPFLPDLAISICSILFLINSFCFRIKNYFKCKFFFFFSLFWLTLIVSSLLSDNIIYSFQTSFLYIRFGIFSLSTWFLIDYNNKIIRDFFFVFCFCFILLIFDGFFQFFTGYNLLGFKIIDTRVSSFFGTELVLGSYLSRLMPLFFACYVFLDSEIKKINFKYFFLIIFVLSEVLIFLSGERVSFFNLNLSAFFYIVCLNHYKKVRITMLLLSFFLIMIISNFSSEYKERMIDRTISQIFVKKEKETNINIFSIEHENHYKSAFLMFEDNKIFGIGTKLFRKNCSKQEYVTSFESCTTHPHNTYVQLLAETGIVGFFQFVIFFLLFIFFSIKHIFLKIFKNKFFFNDFEIFLLSGLLITLWPFIPTGNFFNNWISIIYYLPIGFLLFSINKKINEKKNK